jgi:hypothetical protein
MVADHPHHGGYALVERAMRSVGLQLVVLDEVDAGLDQRRDLLSRRFGREADARLDDRPDQRPAMNPGELAGPW